MLLDGSSLVACGALTICAFQSVGRRLSSLFLGHVQDRLPLQGKAGASLQSIGSPRFGEQTTRCREVLLRSSEVDAEDSLEVFDDKLGVDCGRCWAGCAQGAVGCPWGQRSLHVELGWVYREKDM
jgi:hypothetical protein